jgi:hypothetical protein
MTEKTIKNQILNYLRLTGIEAWLNNPGGMRYRTKEGLSKYVPHGMPGQADISGILPDGRRLEIEVKKPGEKPRPDQWDFLLMIQRSGGVAFWTDNLRCVRSVINQAKAGAWVATDRDLDQIVTTDFRTAPTVQAPTKETRERARR